MALPQAMKRLIDGLMITRDESSLIWLLVLLILVLAESATRVVHGIVLQAAASRISLAAELEAFSRFVLQPIPFFDDERSVELAAHLRNSAETLRDFIARELPDLQRALLRLMAGSFALVWTAPRLALYLTLTLPPLLALSSHLARRLKQGSVAASLAGARSHAAAQESLGAIRVVRALGVEQGETTRFRGIQASAHAANLVMGRLASWADGASLLLSELVTIVALGLGGYMVVSGELTVGALVSFLVYADLVARSSRDLVRFHAHAGQVLGTAHTPGYPFYTIATYLFARVPLGTLAYRVNLFSAVCGVLSCLCIFWMARRLRVSRLLSAAAALAAATSFPVRSNSVTAEVYTLAALMSALTVLWLMMWADSGRLRWLYAACAVFSAGFGNHLTIVAILPAALIYGIAKDRSVLQPRVIATAAHRGRRCGNARHDRQLVGRCRRLSHAGGGVVVALGSIWSPGRGPPVNQP